MVDETEGNIIYNQAIKAKGGETQRGNIKVFFGLLSLDAKDQGFGVL